jgi:hypothetical protein
MKINKVILFFLFPLLALSCSTTYYQVFKASSAAGDIIPNAKTLVWEDPNCIISYNFFKKEGGDPGFIFQNKTKDNIYLDMSQCFFVLNNTAFSYYKNRTISYYSSQTVSFPYEPAGIRPDINNLAIRLEPRHKNSAHYLLSFNESEKVCVPPHSQRIFSEFVINEMLMRLCDLDLYPKANDDPKKVQFDRAQSPLVFSNRLLYTIENQDSLYHVENEFYVSEITNYPEKIAKGVRKDEFCNEEQWGKTSFFTMSTPDRFYVKYSKSLFAPKH